jgi:hypothetical protein
MEPTQPRAPESGEVKATLSGDPRDLFNAAIFLHGVTGGEAPRDVLKLLGLAAISIASMTRRGRTLTITLKLQDAP